MGTDNTATVVVSLPGDLRERARKIAKKHRTSTAQLVRDGLAAHVALIEARDRAEEQLRRAEREGKRGLHRLRRLGESPLAPTALRPIDAPPEREVEDDPAAPIYAQHAALVLAALDGKSLEKRLRVQEAVAAVKRMNPLTHPSDREILARLEREVHRLRGEVPAVVQAKPVDPVGEAMERRVDSALAAKAVLAGLGRDVEREIGPIDVTGLRSLGDV